MPVYRFSGTSLDRLDTPQTVKPVVDGVLSRFTATPTATSVALSWDYAGGELDGLTLSRGSTVIASPLGSTHSFTDTGVIANTSYTYTLTGNLAVAGSGTVNTVSTTTKTLAVPVDPTLPAEYTDSLKPWSLLPGETLLDNVPAGVPIVNASTYSSSTDLFVVLQAIANNGAVPAGVYVRLDQHPRYFINSFVSYGTADWRGWTNGNRKVMGLIGLGADQTSVCVAPGALNAAAGLRDYVLTMTKADGPVPVMGLYLSNTNTNVPMFFSGISFDGTLQGPYGVYAADVQGQFDINKTVASPIAWSGMSLWRGIAGSRMQFCRFRGFGYALLNAPSFECGAVQTNYAAGSVFYRTEIDGRIASEFGTRSDGSRYLSSGGLMHNKDILVTGRHFEEHHTRRSGHAINTNTGRTDERYIFENFQAHDITGLDEYASVTAGFPGTNIEAVVGLVEHTNAYMSISPSNHINYNVPFSGSPGTYVVGAGVHVRINGFRTRDTLYGGCLRIYVAKTPNSTGTSPAWTKITNQGIDGSGIFEIRKVKDGPLLSGVKSTAFNAAIHKPTTHFVVIY